MMKTQWRASELNEGSGGNTISTDWKMTREAGKKENDIMSEAGL